jgi:hypothetical protein
MPAQPANDMAAFLVEMERNRILRIVEALRGEWSRRPDLLDRVHGQQAINAVLDRIREG